MLRRKKFQNCLSPAAVNGSCALKSLRPFWKAQPGSPLLDACDWLFIVARSSPAAALSFCTAPHFRASFFIILQALSLRRPLFLLFLSPDFMQLYIHLTAKYFYSLSNSQGYDAKRASVCSIGLSGNSKDCSLPSLMKCRQLCITAWTGKQEEKEPCTAKSITNVVSNKSSEEKIDYKRDDSSVVGPIKLKPILSTALLFRLSFFAFTLQEFKTL